MEPQLGNCLYLIARWAYLWDILLTNGCWERTQSTVGSVISGLAVLDCVKKQAEQASEHCSSMASA